MRPPSRLILIRRDNPDLVTSILASKRWPAGTALMMDRRERERRVLRQQVILERRKRQRRAEPHAMWYVHGFMVVEPKGLPVQAMLLDATSG